jgi:hypothetical protein
MPTCVATVTAKSGPATQSTALSLTGITVFTADVRRSVLRFYQGGSETDGPAKEFDLNGVTTFTVAISGGNFTVTIS